MYSLLLMAALSSGADLPAWQDTSGPAGVKSYGDHGHREYRFGRGGCWGCRGGCWGGCYGCYGGGWGWGYSCGGCWGGGWGYSGCWGGGGGVWSGRVMASRSYYDGGYSSLPMEPNGAIVNTPSAAAPATIVVSLPEAAKLTIDGAPTQAATSTRSFTTPPLERGREYHYTLDGELMREDGSMQRVSKRVTVRGGETTQVQMDFSEAAAARRRPA